jgi:hypothetical protein
MLRIRHALVPLVLVLAAVAVAAPAFAGVGAPVDCNQNPTDPNCTVQVSTPGGTGTPGTSSTAPCRDPGGHVVPCYVPGKGWYGGGGCWYQLATSQDLQFALAMGGTPTPPAAWYVGSCGDPATNFWPVTMFRVFAAGPGPELLAQEAVKNLRLPLPVIKVNPVPPAVQVLFVPTWLWVDSSSWGSRSATASAGGLSVTATARPVTVEWSTGDGGSRTCTGPGTPWTAGMDPVKESPTCGHTYTIAPTGGRYTLRATVTWEISWVGGGATGMVAPLTTTAALDLPVHEAGAVNSNGLG